MDPDDTLYAYVLFHRPCLQVIMAVIDDPERPEILSTNVDEIAEYLKQGTYVLEHMTLEKSQSVIKNQWGCDCGKEKEEEEKAGSCA